MYIYHAYLITTQIAGRAFIQKNRGALYTASWAKFYLCVLGVMDWDAHNSVPPEMFLLPNWVPFHPGKTQVDRCRCGACMSIYIYPLHHMHHAWIVYNL